MSAPDPHLSEAIARSSRETVTRDSGFDVIIVGGGATGGLAAEMLTRAGLEVLLLDAGWQPSFLRAPLQRTAQTLVEGLANPAALRILPPRLIYAGRSALKRIGRRRQAVQTECYAWERQPRGFVDDVDNPYDTPAEAPFVWLRARQLGGRVAIPGHGRQYYRLSGTDLHPRDGASPDWPLQPRELDAWYARVEARLGLTGSTDGLDSAPDSEIAHESGLTPAEIALHRIITARWPNGQAIVGRYAPPPDTLAEAARTGRLWCRRGAIAREVLSDGQGRANGVRWHDCATGETLQAHASCIFLCASTLESTRLLMLSRSDRAPEGLGARSGALGRYLMDHLLVKAEGLGPGLPEGTGVPEDGRCLFLPRFDAATAPGRFGQRGFGIQLYRTPGGADRSWFTAVAFGEMLPRRENRISLNPDRRDAAGLPSLRIDCRHSPQEREMGAAMCEALHALANLAEVKLTVSPAGLSPPGLAAHECGTARMGRSPDTSVLDPHNECWDMPGLFVTDGAAMPSQGAQNPTLTLMALTARACDLVIRRHSNAPEPAAEATPGSNA